MVEQRQSAIQRIQVGLVGLVVVLLFVSLATMVIERVTEAPTISEVPGSAQIDVSGTSQIAAPDEPLAELGVTPVAKEESEVRSFESAAPKNVRPTPSGVQR